MPSIPQSLLWISLVVLWLFVLVPMLISKRETVRRTSDVALATRVLNTAAGARLLRRRSPAAGHHSDPHWRPSADDLDSYDDDDEPATTPHRAVVLAATKAAPEPDYLDVDIVEEDSGALPIGVSSVPKIERDPQLPLEFTDDTSAFTIDDLQEVDAVDESEPAEEPADDLTDEFEAVTEDDLAGRDADEDPDHDYEYVDDSSGLEAQSDADAEVAGSRSQARRQHVESTTAAAVSARKFRFRKRMLMAMAVLLLASAVTAFVVSPAFWWVCGSVGAVTMLYLGYLRRQTRIEEQVRRRRAQRIKRSRLGVENTDDPEFDVVPARLRRPGSVVLEIDDEDPIFEHLDYVPFARDYDMPHAAGQ